MRMGGEIAAFGEGLRVLSMREQRELLEKLQNANDPAALWTDTAPSWGDLAQLLEKKGKEQSTLLSTARVQLFDAPEHQQRNAMFVHRHRAMMRPHAAATQAYENCRRALANTARA